MLGMLTLLRHRAAVVRVTAITNKHGGGGWGGCRAPWGVFLKGGCILIKSQSYPRKSVGVFFSFWGMPQT